MRSPFYTLTWNIRISVPCSINLPAACCTIIPGAANFPCMKMFNSFWRAPRKPSRIPPRSSYLQGDVETFHRIIEDELYDIENYSNHAEFLGKAYAYQLYFNYVRENRWRDNKSPLELLRERHPHIDEGILNLPPIRLEILLDEEPRGGYYVPGSVLGLFILSCYIHNIMLD